MHAEGGVAEESVGAHHLLVARVAKTPRREAVAWNANSARGVLPKQSPLETPPHVP